MEYHALKAVRPSKLRRELQDTLPALLPQPGPGGELVAVLHVTATPPAVTPAEVWLSAPGVDVDPAAVAAVVDAHDADTPSAAEQQATDDSTRLAAVLDTLAAMLARNQQGQTLLGSATVPAADWAAKTAATKIENLRTVVAGLLEHDERELRALAVLARRLGGGG